MIKRLNLKNKGYLPLALIALIVGGVLFYFYYMPARNLAEVGDTVSVDYAGSLEDGTIFDTSIESVAAQRGIYGQSRPYQPLEFVLGSGGMIRGFENAIVGMKVGETKSVTLQPDDAYGDVREDLIVTVNKSSIDAEDDNIFVGGSVVAENGLRGVVTKMDENNITIDFNHPLAGQILKFEVTLVKIN